LNPQHAENLDFLAILTKSNQWGSESLEWKRTVVLIEKVGEDDYVGVLTSARFLRENGISIPAKGKAKAEDKVDEKPDKKKK
jgi:hypothetical protein